MMSLSGSEKMEPESVAKEEPASKSAKSDPSEQPGLDKALAKPEIKDGKPSEEKQ